MILAKAITFKVQDEGAELVPLLCRMRRQAKVKRINYQGGKWKKKRTKILRLDGYVDRYEQRYGRTVEANTVHHIYPAKEYPEYAWEDWNLLSISEGTHNRLENRITGELTAEGEKLRIRTVPGKDWRKRHDTI